MLCFDACDVTFDELMLGAYFFEGDIESEAAFDLTTLRKISSKVDNPALAKHKLILAVIWVGISMGISITLLLLRTKSQQSQITWR